MIIKPIKLLQEQFLADLFGEGEHILQIAGSDRPTLVTIDESGFEESDDHQVKVTVIDPDSDDLLPLNYVVQHAEQVRGRRFSDWLRAEDQDKYRLFGEQTPEQYRAVKASAAQSGIQVPIIRDESGNLIDGFLREQVAQDLRISCPTEVRHFNSESEKYELILASNCQRRQLNKKQKRKLVVAYLIRDPGISDNWLAELVGGISKNTVSQIRRSLEAECQIDGFVKLRGKDGKKRPVNKKIIANSPKEVERAVEIIRDVPANCSGKTLDLNTAKRRASKNKTKEEKKRQVILPSTEDDIRLFHSRFQDLEAIADIQPGSVNLICTDFPYVAEFLPQIEELAQFAKRVLVDGGLFVTYSGMFHFDHVFRTFGDHLTYRWMSCSCWERGGVLVPSLMVQSHWKPVLIFSKGNWKERQSWSDWLRGPKEKDRHIWQQPLVEAESLVRVFSNPGDLVVDPCGGGFTTAVACRNLHRKYIGCDSEAECVSRGQERLEEAKDSTCPVDELAQPTDTPPTSDGGLCEPPFPLCVWAAEPRITNKGSGIDEIDDRL